MSTQELAKKVKSKLNGLKRRKSFVPYRQSGLIAAELNAILDEIDKFECEAAIGFDLITRFFETDESVMGRCDDSGGGLGAIYTDRATELFALLGGLHENKQKVADTIIDLSVGNRYGVRDYIMDQAKACGVSAELMRSMVDRLQQLAAAEEGSTQRRSLYGDVEKIALQLNDPELFAEMRLLSWGNPAGTAACLNIAEAYFTCGDAETAIKWLDKVVGSMDKFPNHSDLCFTAR